MKRSKPDPEASLKDQAYLRIKTMILNEDVAPNGFLSRHEQNPSSARHRTARA
jgi:hypothetical protein